MKISKPIALIAASIAVAGLGSSVSAQTVVEDVISIPVDSVLRAPAGSVTLIASSPVPPEFQGEDCVADVEAINQESVHPNNDLIIESGDSRGEVLDVESEAFGDVGATVPLTLGSSVEVSLRMGPDEVSSGGLLITIDCPLEPAPTTIPATTQPEAPSTTPPGGVGGETDGNPPTGELPATGTDSSVWVALTAAVLLAGGGGLAYAARRPH